MYRSDINRKLTALSLECKLKDSNGKAIVQEMFEKLKRGSRYSIDRSIIAGSAGKKTALEGSDFDGVVLINDFRDSQRGDILQEFKRLLSQTNARNLTVTPHAVQFKIYDLDVDLLPAGNFVRGERKDTAQQQEEAVRSLIRQDPSKYYEYSAALCESAVEFMRRQSSFVHELAILCKYWNKSVHMPGKISGRSTIIELIAVHAGQEVERSYSTDKMYDGFLKFLSLMENFSTLRICFGSSGATGSSLPMVIEPANPYNNLAKAVSSTQIQAFQAKARETRGRLERAQHSPVSVDTIFA